MAVPSLGASNRDVRKPQRQGAPRPAETSRGRQAARHAVKTEHGCLGNSHISHLCQWDSNLLPDQRAPPCRKMNARFGSQGRCSGAPGTVRCAQGTGTQSVVRPPDSLAGIPARPHLSTLPSSRLRKQGRRTPLGTGVLSPRPVFCCCFFYLFVF